MIFLLRGAICFAVTVGRVCVRLLPHPLSPGPWNNGPASVAVDFVSVLFGDLSHVHTMVLSANSPAGPGTGPSTMQIYQVVHGFYRVQRELFRFKMYA